MTANSNKSLILYNGLFQLPHLTVTGIGIEKTLPVIQDKLLPEILFITSYPSRECGIATYSYDLINAVKKKFGNSFSSKICALEMQGTKNKYIDDVKYILDTSELGQYYKLAQQLNADKNLKLVFIQHEFGLYGGQYGEYVLRFLSIINKPVITTFHTVLPEPDSYRKKIVQAIIAFSRSVVVMTNNSAAILENDYNTPVEKIEVIPHGTHLVSSFGAKEKKAKNYLGNRFVLSTFGLLSSGKSIETALDALPAVIERFPNVLYLIIGKTHPGIIKKEGERYREFLHEKVKQLHLENNVKFVNKYLSLGDLLEYLQRTDIYLFTSKDPYQAVSGTFAYAMSCGCPVISTPIPHAKELLDGAGIIFDFKNAIQLAEATIKLLSDSHLLLEMRLNALHKISPTAWQNAAIAHIELMKKNISENIGELKFQMPEISLAHIKRLTTVTGMLQFSAIAVPDIESGYTLDDNARALIAVTKHYEITRETADLKLIDSYFNFIIFCQQAHGNFLNYVDNDRKFYDKNSDENLEDSNGRAIWALGEIIATHNLFNNYVIGQAEHAIEKSFRHILKLHSPRAIAFSIKGLHHYNTVYNNAAVKQLIISLADNLVSKYRGVSDKKWEWFEEYLTYANSVLPESLLYAYLSTGNQVFKNIAKSSFDFLLSIIFRDKKIKVVSNQGWHIKGKPSNKFGEQPIDVAYTILALGLFYDVFKDQTYLQKMEIAFSWFLGNNHLHQIIYNPCTGGCYDGLEEYHINLNQGAESTVSYLLARLTVEKYLNLKQLSATPVISRINNYELV